MAKTTSAARTARAARRTPQVNPTPTEESTTVSTTTTRRRPSNAISKPAAKAKPAAKKAAPKPKAADKAITVKLKVIGETLRTYKFEFAGTARNPFVKSLYVSKDAIAMANDKPLVIGFKPYVQSGKQKPMPASAIRYSGADTDVCRDIYVSRDQAEKAGFTNDSKVKVTLTIVDEENISLAVSPA